MITLVNGCDQIGDVDNSGDVKVAVDNSNDNEYDFTINEQITWSNNKLGFSLLDKVDPDENNNILISPLSAFMAISLVYNGAEGNTKDEIAKVLGLNNMSVDDLNRANASLLELLDRDLEAVQLEIANSVWVNQDFNIKDAFVKNTTDFYQADITNIDVLDDGSVDKINNWVSKSTKNKIDEIIAAPLDRDLVALLINALYFNGKWTKKFDEQRTELAPFFAKDKKVEVPMMLLESELKYMENASFQAVKLPYGNSEISMNVFLPRENSSIDNFIENVTVDNWQDWNTTFKDKKGTIKLPRFQIEYEVNLNEPLKLLGIEDAFNSRKADFPHMIKENEQLWIDEVKQKTYMDVNEEGTEAAAVTSIAVVKESAIIEDTFYMEVNRPFFITITDDETDTILFMGIIENPV